MAKPPNVAPNETITSAHTNTIKNHIYAWGDNVDANNYGLLDLSHLQLHSNQSLPAEPVAGTIALDGDDANTPVIYDGEFWVPLAGSGGGGGGTSTSSGPWASRPSAASVGAGAVYYATDSPYVSVVNAGGAAWDVYYKGTKANISTSGWSTVNEAGSPTFDTSKGYMRLHTLGTAGVWKRARGSNAYLRMTLGWAVGVVQFDSFSLNAEASTKRVLFGYRKHHTSLPGAVGGALEIIVYKINNGSLDAADLGGVLPLQHVDERDFEVGWNGSQLQFSYVQNGCVIRIYETDYLGGPPTNWGFSAGSSNGSFPTQVTCYNWSEG